MARGVSVSSSTSSSIRGSRAICPPNKFNFMSGCMSWATALSLIALGALIVICFLIMSNRSYGRHTQMIKNDLSVSANGQDRHKVSNPLSINRVDELYEANDMMRNPHDGTGTPTSERMQYDINVNIRDVNPERPNNNMISYAQYDANKSIERIVNPILPPERSYRNTYGTPINIPSRGPNMSYQQIGILYKENIDDPDKQPGNNNDSNILPLFGKPTFNGSRNWNYYTSSDKFQNFKLPINIDGRKCSADIGCKELMNGDMITIPSYNGRFKVEIYDYDVPSYIPFIY